MKIVRVEQNSEEWLQFRLGKIMGSKAKSVKPLSRGADRTPQGYWIMLAEKMAMKSDGEDAMLRGHRLENEGMKWFAKEKKLDIDLEPGVWVSDIEEDIAISPDGAERVNEGSTPRYACEVKCLSSANHLKYVLRDRLAREKSGYVAIDSIPNEAKASYREQVVQYFVVNEQLETLYFILFDDRIGLESLVHHVIEIHRKDIEDLIESQKYEQLDILNKINALIATLVEE